MLSRTFTAEYDMGERIVSAAVLIIGNEILSGRTQDTNLRDIATTLGSWGIRVQQARVVPDEEESIVAAVNELRARFDYVFTTGGIGPTHDDVTAECIAKAFGVELVEHPVIAAHIRRYPARPEIIAAALRMALVPQGAGLIENSTGGPPGFFVENVYVMAGIPDVMRAMLASLEHKLRRGPVLSSRSIVAYAIESAIADPLRALQAAHPEVEIGSYPFAREGRHGTTLVLRGTDEQALARVEQLTRELLIKAGTPPID